MKYLLLVCFPYLSLFLFLSGIVSRVVSWAKSPVPFRIPLVSGQELSLPWVKASRLESPPSKGWVVLRLLTEAVFFRSLLRGETFRLKGERLIFSNRRYLWFFSLLFHLSMLVIILRHLRFFFEPVPDFVLFLQQLDGIFELSHPTVLLSTVLFTSALFYLLSRRIFDERARFVSLPSDYVILLLLLSVAITGILSRHFFRTDLVEIKRLILGLLSFTPYVPKDVSPFFYLHLLSVCLLFAIIPWTKVVHMAGILMSPTRNLPNTSRRERHINPWDYPVKVRTYEEYKKEFGEVMKAQGLDAEERGD